MYLSNLASGRENNLNLIRFLAALSVLVSHSYVISTGDVNSEPLRLWLGITPGNIAVDIFFYLSGFLVTSSILKSKNALDFLLSRFLRIFPALSVMLFATVFLLGPLVTKFSLKNYFIFETYYYLKHSLILVAGISTELPGVFTNNPYPFTVNGSLWTMPWEVRCYLALLLIWILTKLTGKLSNHFFLISTLIFSGVLYLLLLYLHQIYPPLVPTISSLTMFAFGALTWQIRNIFKIGHLLAWSLLLTLILTSFISINLFKVIYPFLLAYIVIYFSYMPRGFLMKYNSVGDYSFGVYLYAFPIQQTVAMQIPNISPLNLTAISSVATITCAFLSWHLIEKKSLGFKSSALKYLRTLIHF
jgi:peptidoglycan/LPS O-acetylase OafA/YrhL